MKKSCSHSPLSETAARDLLSKKGINRTQIKVKVLIEISRSAHPLSIQDIHERLKLSCDVSTLFRTISQFKEKNLVREINLDEGYHRYEMAHSHHHHHHIRCRGCGDIRQIEKCDLSSFEKAITSLGFKDMEHHLEFSGLCSRCS
jgi:Fur family transcriptional regulator, ferric uptake regulator